MLHQSGEDADTKGDTNLLAHVIHADSCCHVLFRGTVIKANELCGEDYSSEETVWEGEKSFPSACHGIGVSFMLLDYVLRAWLGI